MTHTQRWRWLGWLGLPLLVYADVFLRRSLEHADKHLYSFLQYFYPIGEKLIFSPATPWWKLLLPIKEFTGLWAGALVVTHLTELQIGVANTWYLFNAVLVVVSFVTAWLAFESFAFAYTFAICIGFGTHFYHAYTVTGGMASPVIAVALECLLLCSYRFIVAERRAAWWGAGVAISTIAAMLTYEGWLDLVAYVWVAAPILAVLCWRHHRTIQLRRIAGVTAWITAVALAYVFIKLQIGYGQGGGSESDVVFNYRMWAPAIEDIGSNVVTHLYMAATNFLPPVFLSSTALFEMGGDKLVEMQHGYAMEYSYLVPMHYMFLWRYAAGAVALLVGYFLIRAIARAWRQPTADRIALIACLLMMVMAGSTHALVKIRPMKTMPVLGYHVFVGVVGVSLLLSYWLMMAWRDWRSTSARVVVTAGVWVVIFYSALARPIMLNHMAIEVGLPGLYPNPMNELRLMLGRPADPTGDLAGYRLYRNLPKPDAAPAPAPAPPPPPPSVDPTGRRPLGEGLVALPESVIDLSVWDKLQDVKVTAEPGGYVVDGNSAGGYQLMSPLMALPKSERLLIRALGTTERGRICLGVLDGSQQNWLHAPGGPESEFIFETGMNTAGRVVFAACPGDTVAPRFHVRSITYAILKASSAIR